MALALAVNGELKPRKKVGSARKRKVNALVTLIPALMMALWKVWQELHIIFLMGRAKSPVQGGIAGKYVPPLIELFKTSTTQGKVPRMSVQL